MDLISICSRYVRFQVRGSSASERSALLSLHSAVIALSGVTDSSNYGGVVGSSHALLTSAWQRILEIEVAYSYHTVECIICTILTRWTRINLARSFVGDPESCNQRLFLCV